MKAPLTLAATAMLALAACNKQPSSSNGALASATSAAIGDPSGKAKLGAYTQGYNKLLNTFGLPATQKSYFEEEIARKSPSDSISVSDGWLKQALVQLRKARAMAGGEPDVDASADRLIAALDTVTRRLGALNVYYTSKAYRDDGLKRGKAEDAPMRAEFAAATTAMEQFSMVLDRERKKATVAEMAAMKVAGDTLGYNNKLALQQAEDVIDLFQGNGDLKNPAVFAKGDMGIAALEKTLADQRAEITRAEAAAKPGHRVDVNYGLVVDRLTSQIGDYRDLRQSRDADDYNDMVKSYNDAIEDANDIG